MAPVNTLIDLHKFIFKQAPIDEQFRLYKEFPEIRGFSYSGQNIPLFQATLVLVLSQALFHNPEGERSYLFLPKGDREWSTEQLKEHIKRVIQSVPRASRPRYVERIRLLSVGHQVHQIDEPPRWAAYGFTSNVVPSWIARRLCEVSL
jgi:hypothetical protein